MTNELICMNNPLDILYNCTPNIISVFIWNIYFISLIHVFMRFDKIRRFLSEKGNNTYSIIISLFFCKIESREFALLYLVWQMTQNYWILFFRNRTTHVQMSRQYLRHYRWHYVFCTCNVRSAVLSLDLPSSQYSIVPCFLVL